MLSPTEAASPKISIVIPCLNEKKSIGRLLGYPDYFENGQSVGFWKRAKKKR
jgi:hypothetical protein